MKETDRHRIDVDDLGDWVLSDRIYEKAVFIQTLMLIGILILGMNTFGFEIHADQKQNLLENFLYYLLLVGAMALVPPLYRMLFARKKTQTQKDLEATEPGEYRDDLTDYYRLNGLLPPTRWQNMALVAAFAIMLFELFYLNAWVKNLQLVWQPAWVDSIIAWVKHHINTPPLNVDWDLFDLEMKDSELVKLFPPEQIFLNSPLSNSFLLFHFWRFVSYGIFFFCWCIVIWRAVDWLGMERINPKNIETDTQFLLISFISLFLSLMIIVPIYPMMLIVSSFTSDMILSNEYWLHGISVNGIMIPLGIVSLKLWNGWFIYWKRQFSA